MENDDDRVKLPMLLKLWNIDWDVWLLLSLVAWRDELLEVLLADGNVPIWLVFPLSTLLETRDGDETCVVNPDKVVLILESVIATGDDSVRAVE